MGYRNYFLLAKKDEINKVSSMTYSELQAKKYEITNEKGMPFDDDDCDIYLFDLFENQTIFEFGKLYWDDTIERICATGTKMFKDEKVFEYFSDNDPYIVGKEAVEVAIGIYKNKVVDYMKEILEKPKEEKDALILEDFESEFREIQRGVCDTNESRKYSVTHSWYYKYSVFNLVHILKTVDWEKYTLLFVGW